MTFFYWIVASGCYCSALVLGVRQLPARWRRLLALLYGLTTGLWVASALGYVLTFGEWSCRSSTMFAGLLLLSGWAALVRHPFELLARLQAGLLGLAGTLLLCTSSAIVYQDAAATVTVSPHFTLQDGEPYNEVTLYRSYLLLFDQRVGQLSPPVVSTPTPSTTGFQQAAWWRGAQDLSFDLATGQGQVMGPTGIVAFSFNPLR